MILLACFEAIRNYDVGAVAPKGVGGNSPTAVSPSFSKISCGNPVGFVWRKLTHVCNMRHSHLKARCNWVHGSVSVVGGKYWLRRISHKPHGRYSGFVGICCRQTLSWLPWGVEAVGRCYCLAGAAKLVMPLPKGRCSTRRAIDPMAPGRCHSRIAYVSCKKSPKNCVWSETPWVGGYCWEIEM